MREHLQEEINPWLGLSLNIWFEIISKNSLTEHSKVLRWIAHDSDFTPNTKDSRFSRWEVGPKIFWELFKKKAIKSFRDLKNQYGLNNQDLYRYLQMRHYMEQNIKKFNLDELESGIIKLFISAYDSEQGKKLNSKLYKEIKRLKGNNNIYKRKVWKRGREDIIRGRMGDGK